MNDQRRPLATPGDTPHTPPEPRPGGPTVTAGQIHDRLLSQLAEVLDEERRLTEQLSALAQTVQRHILADECEEMLVTAQEQEECVRRLAQAEYVRLSLVRQLAPYHAGLSRMRLSQWVERLPEPHLSTLRPIGGALAKAALHVQRLNRQNKALIQRSLRFAELALGVEPATYGGGHRRYGTESDSPHLYDQTL